MRYTGRYLNVIGERRKDNPKEIKTVKTVNIRRRQREYRRSEIKKNLPPPPKKASPRKTATVLHKNGRRQRRIVGSPVHRNKLDATKHLRSLLKVIEYPISNNIGVGILSYNRLHSLKRLIKSIRQHTDMSKTTIFVSDESTDKNLKSWLTKQKDIVPITNDKRLGVAGNTNRLLRCLDRFKYKILLNDDVEVLRTGWDKLYPAAMEKLKYHHFCMRQPGLLEVKRDNKVRTVEDVSIETITDKPHGAVMAFDDVAFEKVGYFDEQYGLYGIEHVDWSNRISMSGIQPPGYHDLVGSDNFFKIHKEQSAIPSAERTRSLKASRDKFAEINKKSRIYVKPTNASKVEEVSCIIPFSGRDNRLQAIKSVVDNIRAQRFPRIEIILSEQDDKTRIKQKNVAPCRYFLAKAPRRGQAFTKSIAVNFGVHKATCNDIILHDADMLVRAGYITKVFNVLRTHDSCHLGKTVFYLDPPSTNKVNVNGEIGDELSALKTVGYFEGGSLACKKKTFWNVGGFNEDFIGYGVEDCEFYERLSQLSNFYGDRQEALIHLHHSRSRGWEDYHIKNKKLGAQIKRMRMQDRLKVLRKQHSKKGYI